MARTDTLGNYLTDVASAIKTKKGDSTPILASNFDTEIINLPSGGATLQSKSIEITTNGNTTVSPDTGYDGLSQVAITTNVSGGSTEPVEKNVNLYDYDGTRLFSYTTSEFLALTEYPTAPTHTGLTFDGWTFSLADAKTFVQNFKELDLGAYYKTTDDKTKIYIEIPSTDFLSIGLSYGYTAGQADTLTIDWGDGTTTDVSLARATSPTAMTADHNYSNIGSYVITLTAGSNVYLFFEQKSNIANILKPYGTSARTQTPLSLRYLAMIKKIEFGVRFSIRNGAFAECVNLETIAFSSTFYLEGSTFSYTYYDCKKLKCIIVPKVSGASYINISGALKNNTELKRLLFPNIDIRNLVGTLTPTSPEMINSKRFVYIGNLTPLFSVSSSATLIAPWAKKVIIGNQFNASNTINISSTSAMSFPFIEELVIGPSAVVTISSNGLNGLNNLKVLDLSRLTAIATMSGTSLGQYFPNTCKIVVPDSLYSNWIADTNWSNYSSQIIKASDYFGS